MSLSILESLYSQPHRRYHTLAHVEALLRWAEEFRDRIADFAAVEQAIWFHDAIYDPRAADNEERSAQLARAEIDEESLRARVTQMILATKSHLLNDPNDGDLALFLDFDLSILGSDEATYDAYAQQIREEYEFVPEPFYRRERKRVLQRFLDRPHIYFNEEMRRRLEANARANIAREIARL